MSAAARWNIWHLLARIGTYESNGGHPIPQRDVDFTGLAQAAGYAHCVDFKEVAAFEAALDTLLTQDGPIFGTLHIEKGALSPEFNYRKLDDPRLRADFRAALRA